MSVSSPPASPSALSEKRMGEAPRRSIPVEGSLSVASISSTGRSSDRSHCKPSNYILHSYSSMLITNIEIGTINGEVVEVAINVVVW